MFGEDTLFGLVGKPTLGIFTNYANFDWSNFVFNLVFCATTATIVSGAMAERTKFISYLFIQELFLLLFTQSRLTGFGVAAGFHSSVFMILQVVQQSTW